MGDAGGRPGDFADSDKCAPSPLAHARGRPAACPKERGRSAPAGLQAVSCLSCINCKKNALTWWGPGDTKCCDITV